MSANPEKIKIVCTIGPSSKNADVMCQLQARDIHMARINLSHVPIGEIEDYIHFLKQFSIPVCIDTEGSQIRTGKILNSTGTVTVQTDDLINLHGEVIPCDSENIYLTPFNIIQGLRPGDMLAIDFNSVLLKVVDVKDAAATKQIKCSVLIGGELGSNKGVHCYDTAIKLPVFSEKDLKAFELAKKHGVNYFTLSFIDNEEEVKYFRQILPDAIAYAKIETLSGVQNVESILKHVNGILIDRGDLSRDIVIEKIPLTQKILIETARLAGKEVFVASNLLDTMALDLKPSRAEANDIVNTVIDGATGFVLTKETAVGRYPVQTVNMLANLIRQGTMALTASKKADDYQTRSLDLSALRSSQYMTDKDMPGFLVSPHGGKLIDRFDPGSISVDALEKLPTLHICQDTLMDLEQIAVGTYSPLEGFMGVEDLNGVLSDMRLKSGLVWTVPIILPVSQAEAQTINANHRLSLTYKGDHKIYGFIDVSEVYPFQKEEYCLKIYGTIDPNHPGVERIMGSGDFLIAGKITLTRRLDGSFLHHNLTPRQSRSLFEALGWSKVVGFHTRNVIHRSHEYIQLQALRQTGCDGIFVHPVIGRKKAGDFTTEIIVKAYELMLEKFYPKNRVVFGVFSTYSRYAGPREAVFTALCRKNFGCSHFIVGRDHTGVGDYYSPTASQDIFSQFPDLGIVPVFFGVIGYSEIDNAYKEQLDSESKNFLHLSGSKVRDMLKQNVSPPTWLIRPEITKILLGSLGTGQKVFVD